MLSYTLKKNKYNNVGCIAWDLIIWMTYWLREIISKSHNRRYINFDNRLLVGVEFTFLKLR